MAKTLYLANPYGFSAQQNAGPLKALVAALEALGAEVWEPFARNNQIDKAAAGWAWRIGQADLRDVQGADGIFAVVNGCPPDEGVMVELGMAIAWEKAVFLFRDDFRRCTDSEAYPLNLMVFTGLPERGLGGVLVRLGRRDRRSRQGARPLAAGGPRWAERARLLDPRPDLLLAEEPDAAAHLERVGVDLLHFGVVGLAVPGVVDVAVLPLAVALVLHAH